MTEITLAPLDDPAGLKIEWCRLADRVPCSVFLTWTWIGPWLDACRRQGRPAPILLTARTGDRVTALALLGRHRLRRRLMTLTQWCLHETGDPAFDRVMIEHNGFLLDPDHAPPPEALFQALADAEPGWHELVLPGVPAELAAAAGPAGLVIETDRRHRCFAVDLDAARRAGGLWIDRLSANSRAQLRQATRAAAAAGPLALTAARDRDEGLCWFDAMAVLHQRRWAADGIAGAFGDPAIVAFQRAVIAQGLETGTVELLRATAGDAVLGYLYQFRHRGVVSAYQAGYRPSEGNQDRPGLVLHRLAIERALDMGDRSYDLMAGDARYKRSLGEEVRGLVWCRAQRPHAGLALERGARQLAGLLRRR